MDTTQLNTQAIMQRVRDQQQRETAAIEHLTQARVAAITAIAADAEALQAALDAGVTVDRLRAIGIPDLPAPAPVAAEDAPAARRKRTRSTSGRPARGRSGQRGAADQPADGGTADGAAGGAGE